MFIVAFFNLPQTIRKRIIKDKAAFLLIADEIMKHFPTGRKIAVIET